MKSPIEEKLARHLEPMLAEFNGAWTIQRQVRFGKYTADFVVQRGDELSVVIECDGHTYHDRTDEQATHDRVRDRWFLRNGMPTIRFSSSEIFNNALACCTELIRTITGILRDRRKERDDAAWRAEDRSFEQGYEAAKADLPRLPSEALEEHW